jgi:hypothetical protein
MTLYDVLKTYGSGKGESAMWQTTKIVSDALVPMKEAHPEKYWQLIKDIYAVVAGPHYNEEFGQWQIEQMCYVDSNGNKVMAPHWTKAQYQAAYEQNRSRLNKTYTAWDFAVAIEMQYSDYICLLRDWYPSATEQDLDAKAIQLAVAYLNDPDDDAEGKIWRRFNTK